ncbi:MAG: FAD-dependent oxidoreductase [Candidatus Korarchaeota archaeon]|nr:FAD-dependent oxidoreductase [Candidatus Korarchaeota archaeon]
MASREEWESFFLLFFPHPLKMSLPCVRVLPTMWSTDPTPRKSTRLVILGGGFCGTSIAQRLDSNNSYEITLIDENSYFEYTPALPKLLTDPEYLSDIIVPYSQFLDRTTILSEKITKVTPHFVETEERRVTFDYLVISTGIKYPIRLDNPRNVFPIKKAAQVIRWTDKIRSADHILIIGGGVIGTEVAGELTTKTPEKKVTLVHAHERLLERTPSFASHFAQSFLEAQGVTVHLGEKIIQQVNGQFLTDHPRTINADLAVWCAGIEHDPWFMEEFNNSIFTENGALRVNAHLQLVGHPHIYVGGDLTSIKEEKTAYNAKRHAKIIGTNLIRELRNTKLKEYTKHPTPLVISLGNRNGLFVFSPLTLPGSIPALLKWGIKKREMRKFSPRF